MKHDKRYERSTKAALHMSLCCMVGGFVGWHQLLPSFAGYVGRFIRQQLHTTY